MAIIAILTSNPAVRHCCVSQIASLGHEVLEERLSSSGIHDIPRRAHLAVVECSPDASDPGLECVRRAHRRQNPTPIVIIASESSEGLAIAGVRLGARDYLKHPFTQEEVAATLHRCLPANEQLGELDGAIIGNSTLMESVKTLIRRVAPTNCSVMITGETGTGKEVVAQHVHRLSSRRHKSIVCVNCAAIPESLLESELFGYEKGAFTGAVSARDGKLKQADGGTVFFDEIGDMSLQAQAKILRAIEAKEIYPLGGNRRVRIDIRVIAATHRDLESMAREERFRSDLLFRLNVARIKLPPLRERPSDILPLIEHLLPQYNQRFGCHVEGFSEEALCQIREYSWPGNVRELKNVLEVIFLNLPSRKITAAELPDQVRTFWRSSEGLPQAERERMLSALFETHWNISEAARKLHWSRMTLYRKLAKHHIVKSQLTASAGS
jgi:DNA-binding NtrC family response regulator